MFPYDTIPQGMVSQPLLVVASLCHAGGQDSLHPCICLSVSSELRCSRGRSLSPALSRQRRAQGTSASAFPHYLTHWEWAVMSIWSPPQERGWQTRWAGGSRWGPRKLGTVPCRCALRKDENQSWSKVGSENYGLTETIVFTGKSLESKSHSWLSPSA